MQWDEQKLWSTYTMLTDLEAVFRSLKSELGMRPVYHQKTHRVEGHIFITLLAYNLVHQVRCQLKAQGIDDSWDKIRTTMSTQVRVTTSLR
jgi:transposase